jgi:hypothetical protein
VELPQTMQRAMARQAEAEREKRAKIIHAQGELQASQQLSEAAHVIGSEPATIQLRYLQTLTEIATERNSTIIFPVPIELLALIPHFMPTSTSTNGHAPVVAAPEEPVEHSAARLAGASTVPPTQPLRPDVETVAPDPTAPPPGFAPRP